MSIQRFFLAAFLLCLAGWGALITYQAYVLWRAHGRTDQIRSATLSRPQAITLQGLTAEQKDILLTVEDPAFFAHRGVDFSSPGQGMATITQALVKRLYFEEFHPGLAKIEQSLIAVFVLNRRFTKEEQLTVFLNQAYLGEQNGQPVLGFAEASRAYFGKPFHALTMDEFIGLVGMLIAPNTLRPDLHPEAHQQRVQRIKLLLAGGCQPKGVFDPWYRECGGIRPETDRTRRPPSPRPDQIRPMT